jgi:hypothetical protein
MSNDDSMSELVDAEKAAEELTYTFFEDELNHLEKMFRILYRTYSLISDSSLTKDDYKKWSIYLLYLRNYRIFRCVYEPLLHGYYDVAHALMRMACENCILISYLSDREEEAKKWLHGKRFTPKFLRPKIREKISFDKIYRQLSYFIHTDSAVMRYLFEKKGTGLHISITDFNPLHFYEILEGYLIFGQMTLEIVQTTFLEDLEDAFHEELRDLFIAGNDILKDFMKKVESKQKLLEDLKAMQRREK